MLVSILLAYFVYLLVLAASDISFLMSAAVVFRGPCRLRLLGGDAFFPYTKAGFSCLMSADDVSHGLAVVCSEGDAYCLPRLLIKLFCFQTFWVEPH